MNSRDLGIDNSGRLASIPRCVSGSCTGFYDAIGHVAPAGTLICTFPRCAAASERVPGDAAPVVEGDDRGASCR